METEIIAVFAVNNLILRFHVLGTFHDMGIIRKKTHSSKKAVIFHKLLPILFCLWRLSKFQQLETTLFTCF